MNKKSPATPTLDKLNRVAPESQAIGAFLEWLQGQGKSICIWRDGEKVECFRCCGTGLNPDYESTDSSSFKGCSECSWPFEKVETGAETTPSGWFPVVGPGGVIQSLLHEYFEIDATEEENERRAVLGYVRGLNEARKESE